MIQMPQLYQRIRLRGLSEVLKFVLHPVPSRDMVRLGSAYGGWWIPESAVGEGAVAYCAGAGEDVTFDIALAELGVSVTVFDPTPRAIAHVESCISAGARLRLVRTGWWSQEKTLRFYAPQDPAHVSHSVVNLQRTTDYFEADVDTVASLQSVLGDKHVTLIKMDIEGAEYEVLASMLADGPLPEVLCVEFDQPEPVWKTLRCVRQLRDAGYILRKIEHWNFTFVR